MRKVYFPPVEGAPSPLRVTVSRQVRFEEVDAMGIVWHGRYASYFEDGRVALGRRYGISYSDFIRELTPVPIRQMIIEYHHPLRFEEDFEIETILHWSEAARLNFEYVIRNTEGRLVSSGCTVQLMLDRDLEVLLAPPTLLRGLSGTLEARGVVVMAVHVVQADAITALGRGAQTLWEGLNAGRSGLSAVRRFATDHYVAHVAGCIPALDAERPGSRLDALVDLLFADTKLPQDCQLITASTKAGVDQLEKAVRGQPAPLDSLLGVRVADRVAVCLGLKGPRQHVSAACASATFALSLGASRITQGQAEAVLVCGLDLFSEFIFSGFSSLMALSPTVCRPFDVERDGLLLGEGAAYVLLMSDSRRRREGRVSLGRLVGWGASGDAHHVTAPSREGEGLIRAIGQALDRAALSPGEVGAISAHGTGSVYNDAMELTAFDHLFHRRVPFYSVKGATGHTMGASGAIETVVGLWSLRHHRIPPTVGLRTPEPAAGSRVSEARQSIEGDYLLVTNSGFGGVNAAVVLTGEGAS